MLTAIEIENFKAFGERQRIELRPITLLFGPNSGGKSSIIHAIHFAREVLVRGNINVHRPESGGELLDLGGIHSFVHGRRLGKNPIRLKLEFDLVASDLPALPAIPGHEMESDDAPWQALEGLRSAAIEIEISPVADPYVSQYTVWLNDLEVPFARISASASLPYSVISQIRWDHPLFRHSDAGEDRGVLSAMYSAAGGTPGVDSQFQIDRPRKAIPAWGELLNPHMPTGSDAHWSSSTSGRSFVQLLTNSLVGPGHVLRNLLERFRYVGPLRTLPPRGWRPPEVSEVAGWPSGISAWQCLRDRDNPALLQAVNTWLSGKEHLDTDYSIARVPYRELPSAWIESLTEGALEGDDPDHSGGLLEDISNTPVRHRVDLEYRGRRMELQDVGVGISQVLPVIVGAVDTSLPIVAFEQPELHLHPKQQAALGDVFVEAMHNATIGGNERAAEEHKAATEAWNRQPDHLREFTEPPQHKATGKYTRLLLIETHSEHLILRLMRRVRETTAGHAPPLRSLDRSQMTILHVEHADGESCVLEMRIDRDGDLLQPWPDTFFDQDSMERFA